MTLLENSKNRSLWSRLRIAALLRYSHLQSRDRRERSLRRLFQQPHECVRHDASQILYALRQDGLALVGGDHPGCVALHHEFAVIEP